MLEVSDSVQFPSVRRAGQSGGRTARLIAPLLAAVLVLCAAALAASPALAGVPVRAALMINMNTGRILYQKNADMAIPPASLTKVMTSFLVHDAVAAGRFSMQTKVRISPQVARVGGSTMRLRSGEYVTIENLLRGAIIASGNDAATALALATSGSQRAFVQAMNAKAARLGMKRTRFRNPTGLPAAGQVTTARDLARLCRAYMSRHPGAMRIHSTSSFRHRKRMLTTTNPFLGSRGVNGLKTGFTLSSGYNIILTTRGKTRLLIVVLGGKSKARRESAASTLLAAGLKYPNSAQKVQQLVGGPSGRQLGSTKKSGKVQKARPVAKKKSARQDRSGKKKAVKKQGQAKKSQAKQSRKAKQAQTKQSQTRNKQKQGRGKGERKQSGQKRQQ
ncbi:MAG: serine hydrolase [Desulfovibrionaceae bacterium]|nr:serine hydrolase [Desulfovibrionaceae bacterium]